MRVPATASRVALALELGLACFGWSAEPATTLARIEAPPPAANRRYLLGPRDLLLVTVYTRGGTSDGHSASIEFPVDSVGSINLPLVGKFTVVGRTTRQVEDALVAAYRKFLNDPQVGVVVKEYRSKRVHLVGQVAVNGPVYLEHEDTTLFEVVARAGGFVNAADPLENADQRNVIVQRGATKQVIDFYGAAISATKADTFVVQDGDYIYVPKTLHRVSVLGGVKNATEVELRPGTTLLEAISKAGSFTERSRRDQVRILRKDGKGGTTTIPIDATRIFHGKAPDLALEPGDVIYVSEW
ncbi:MAG: polysaccharide biosynthesis/export family protein [Armatimonadetes bacterium]|nr:polysaccharide biosynthesis/export family protein [Armatimonadota bacterium]